MQREIRIAEEFADGSLARLRLLECSLFVQSVEMRFGSEPAAFINIPINKHLLIRCVVASIQSRILPHALYGIRISAAG